MIRHHAWFHDVSEVALPHALLKPGFRHCLRASWHGDGWVVRDFHTTADHTEVMTDAAYLEKLWNEAGDPSLRVLSVLLPEPEWSPLPVLSVMSCAQVAAHGLGLRRWLPWTPYALYRALLDRGAEHVIGEPT